MDRSKHGMYCFLKVILALRRLPGPPVELESFIIKTASNVVQGCNNIWPPLPDFLGSEGQMYGKCNEMYMYAFVAKCRLFFSKITFLSNFYLFIVLQKKTQKRFVTFTFVIDFTMIFHQILSFNYHILSSNEETKYNLINTLHIPF